MARACWPGGSFLSVFIFWVAATPDDTDHRLWTLTSQVAEPAFTRHRWGTRHFHFPGKWLSPSHSAGEEVETGEENSQEAGRPHVSPPKTLVHLRGRQQLGTGMRTMSSGLGVSEPSAHQCRGHRPVGLGQDTRSSSLLGHREPCKPVYTPGRSGKLARPQRTTAEAQS